MQILWAHNKIPHHPAYYLLSDYDFSWLCSNFMESNGKLLDHDQGDNITKLGALTFANFIPRGIESLSAKELLAFREKSKDERHLFFDEMQKFSDTIMNVNDEKIITDIFNERIKDFQKCRDEYMKRMRDIKIEGFYGAKTVMFPLITTLATSLMNVSSEVARVLDVCGVCCGVIGGIWDTKRKLRAEAKKYRPNIAVSNNENSITCAMQYCFNISIPFTFLKIFLNSFILSLYYHKIIYTFHIYSVSVILMIRQKFSMPIFNHIGIHLFYHLNTYDNNTI